MFIYGDKYCFIVGEKPFPIQQLTLVNATFTSLKHHTLIQLLQCNNDTKYDIKFLNVFFMCSPKTSCDNQLVSSSKQQIGIVLHIHIFIIVLRRVFGVSEPDLIRCDIFLYFFCGSLRLFSYTCMHVYHISFTKMKLVLQARV